LARVKRGGPAAHLVRAGVDASKAAHIAYPIMMMLHGVVMHRLLNRKQSPLGRAIAAACLDACMTLLESARQEIACCDSNPRRRSDGLVPCQAVANGGLTQPEDSIEEVGAAGRS
jgi:hypothetical protein